MYSSRKIMPFCKRIYLRTILFLIIFSLVFSNFLLTIQTAQAVDLVRPQESTTKDDRIHISTYFAEYYWGSTIPLVVEITDATNIDRVLLKIKDNPGTGIVHLKTIYNNQRQEDKFVFSYLWDTQRAETVPDNSWSQHQIIAEGYKKVGSQYIFQGSTTASVKVTQDPNYQSYDPANDGFWGAYISDKELSQDWRDKLNCRPGECITQDIMIGKINTAIQNDKLTQEDMYIMGNAVDRYTLKLQHDDESNRVSKEKMSENLTTLFVMMDFMEYLAETYAAKEGQENNLFSEDLGKLPRPDLAMNVVVDNMAVLQSLPNYNDIESFKKDPTVKDLTNEILATQPQDQASWDEAQDGYDQMTEQARADKKIFSKKFSLRPKAAKAIIPIILGAIYVGGILWSGYDLYKDPGNAWNWGMMGLSLLPGGILEKLGVKIGGKFGTKILGGLAGKYGAKAGPLLAKYGVDIKKLKAYHRLGKYKLSKFWRLAPGWLKALIVAAGVVGAAGIYTAASNDECVNYCTGKSDLGRWASTAATLGVGVLVRVIFKANWATTTIASLGIGTLLGFAPIQDAACVISCWLLSIEADIFNWAMAVFQDSLGVSFKPMAPTCRG